MGVYLLQVCCGCCNCCCCFFLSLFCFVFFFHFKFHFLSTGRGSLFSNLLLCKIIDMACCIAMVFMSMMVSFVVLFGIFNCSSNILIEELCVFAIAPAVMMSTSSTFHPLLLMLSRRGWDFLVSRVMAFHENLSLQYVNSIN